jgi:hypothetical protein
MAPDGPAPIMRTSKLCWLLFMETLPVANVHDCGWASGEVDECAYVDIGKLDLHIGLTAAGTPIECGQAQDHRFVGITRVLLLQRTA